MAARLGNLLDHLFKQHDLVTKKFYLVIGVFAVIVFSLVALSHFQAHVLDSVRTYVGGEGFWSKGQKDAVLHLEHYADNHDPEEYALFLKGLQPSLGDREARLALQSIPPDLERAREGFLNGRNHPDDVDDAIRLFLYFHEVSYMKKVIELWGEGDALIDELLQLGKAIDSEVRSPSPDQNRVQNLVGKVNQLNTKVGELEDRFSATLGDAARWITGLTSNLMLITMLLLLGLGTAMSRQIVKGIRETQADLVASESRFRHVVESNMIGILFWYADGSISYANDLLLRTIGYDRDELDKGLLNWQRLTPREYAELDRKALNEVAESGYCDPYEKEFRHKDGHLVSVLIGAASLNGTKQGGVCFVIDISERKKAEQAQRLAATVFHSASEAIFVTDGKPSIRAANPAFCKITGYSEEEVLGRNPNILSSGMHDSAFYKAMWHKLIDEGGWTGEIINRRKNGDIYQEWLSITAVRDKEGIPREFVGVFTDITELRKMEERLRQSQKMEAIGTLVGGIAHDFNNTLAAMKGNLYLAQQENAAGKDIADRLRNIDTLGDHSADMVHQLMTFARKDIVRKSPLSLNELMKTHERLTSSIMPENIELTMHICDDELWINGDATQLQQVLLNLLNNARDAVADCDAPAITINLEWLRPDKGLREKHPGLGDGEVAHISVSDNGYGMDEDQLTRIFEPFYSTKEVGKGTGLGMSMIYGSIQTHNGAIDIDSSPGKGTSVHLYLPLQERLEPQERAADITTGANGATTTAVLLVDDEPGIRAFCAETLKSIGHQVLSAGDGVEGLELFKANREQVGLVITDIVMPRQGGFKMAEQIRMLKAGVPLIFMTGYDPEQAGVPDALQRNSSVITKPFAIDELKRQINSLLPNVKTK